MDYKEFAQRVKSKHPDYNDMPDDELARKLVAKYPNEYSDVTFDSGSEQSQEQGFLDTMSNAAGRITDSIPAATSLMSPTLGLAQYAGQQMNNASGELGGVTAEKLGAKGVNPYLAAAGGMAASILSNPMTYVDPGAGFSGKVFKPVAPLERQAAVGAAERIGMPLRRGEVTGSKASLGLSNFMEKTVMGSGPEEAFTANQNKALGVERTRIQDSVGNPGDVYAVGSNAQSKIAKRGSVMRSARDVMFDAIPDDVVIPLTEYARHGDDVISKQSKVRPITRNPEVTKFAQDAQTPYQSTGQGVTGGDINNYTRRTPDVVIPERTVFNAHETPTPDQPGLPYTRSDSGEIIGGSGAESTTHYTAKRIPGQRIDGENVYEAGYSASPEKSFAPKSNYFEVKELRETLSAKISEAERSGNGKAYREFTQMKKALDSDIENFANSEASPLDSMMAKEFKQSYRKANAFHGAYKGLYGSDEAKALLNADPNKVVDMVFKGRNNETAIKQFRALAGEDGFLPAKQTFTKELLDSPNLTKELGKYEEGHLRSIYSAQELKELSDYGLAQGLRKTSNNSQATTGAIVAGQYTGLGAGIISLLHGNVGGAAAGIGQFLAPAVISRMNLGLAGGLGASLGRSSLQAIKTLTNSGASSSRRNLITQFIDNRSKGSNQ